MQKPVKQEGNSLRVISKEPQIDLKCPDGEELTKRSALKEKPKKLNNLHNKLKSKILSLQKRQVINEHDSKYETCVLDYTILIMMTLLYQ